MVGVEVVGVEVVGVEVVGVEVVGVKVEASDVFVGDPVVGAGEDELFDLIASSADIFKETIRTNSTVKLNN